MYSATDDHRSAKDFLYFFFFQSMPLLSVAFLLRVFHNQKVFETNVSEVSSSYYACGSFFPVVLSIPRARAKITSNTVVVVRYTPCSRPNKNGKLL